jgi:hypothetical protein
MRFACLIIPDGGKVTDWGVFKSGIGVPGWGGEVIWTWKIPINAEEELLFTHHPPYLPSWS